MGGGETVKWNTVYTVLKFKNTVKREVETVKYNPNPNPKP